MEVSSVVFVLSRWQTNQLDHIPQNIKLFLIFTERNSIGEINVCDINKILSSLKATKRHYYCQISCCVALKNKALLLLAGRNITRCLPRSNPIYCQCTTLQFWKWICHVYFLLSNDNLIFLHLWSSQHLMPDAVVACTEWPRATPRIWQINTLTWLWLDQKGVTDWQAQSPEYNLGSHIWEWILISGGVRTPNQRPLFKTRFQHS